MTNKLARLATTPPFPWSVGYWLSQLQGTTVTQGWDVVHAMSAIQVNELFQWQFVQNLATSSYLNPINGTVSLGFGISVEVVDFRLGCPLIAIDASANAGTSTASLTIPIISGTMHQLVGGTVVLSQSVTPASGFSITGTVPLASVAGEVEDQNDIVLQIANATAFFANLNLSPVFADGLGSWFLEYLKDNSSNFSYSLGTLDTSSNGTDLWPNSGFVISTQVDLQDPTDQGRVLLFIPTQYNPGGGSQASLQYANIIPSGYDTALFISSKVIFENILGTYLTNYLSGFSSTPTTVASSQTEAGAYMLTIQTGAIDVLPVTAIYPVGWSYVTLGSGALGDPKPVDLLIPLDGIVIAPSTAAAADAITIATLETPPSWSQPWAVFDSSCAIYGMSVGMHLVVACTSTVSVDCDTSEVSFSTSPSDLAVSFDHSHWWAEVFGPNFSTDSVGDLVVNNTSAILDQAFQLPMPEIGTFCVSSLLFPSDNVLSFSAAYVPGDLVLLGTIQSSDFTVCPALATIASGTTTTLVASEAVTWAASVGSIDDAGVYTAPSTASQALVAVITATSTTSPDSPPVYAAVLVVPASVQVNPMIMVIPANSGVYPLTAGILGASTTPTWSISPSTVGSIDSSGNYTPPSAVSTPAAAVVTATIDGSTGTANIVMIPSSSSSVLQVMPYVTATLGPNQTQTFTASDSASNGGTPQWSVLPPIGSISAGGVYTAPATISTNEAVVVLATDDLGNLGTAVVLLAPDAPGSPGDATFRRAAKRP